MYIVFYHQNLIWIMFCQGIMWTNAERRTYGALGEMIKDNVEYFNGT